MCMYKRFLSFGARGRGIIFAPCPGEGFASAGLGTPRMEIGSHAPSSTNLTIWEVLGRSGISERCLWESFCGRLVRTNETDTRNHAKTKDKTKPESSMLGRLMLGRLNLAWEPGKASVECRQCCWIPCGRAYLHILSLWSGKQRVKFPVTCLVHSMNGRQKLARQNSIPAPNHPNVHVTTRPELGNWSGQDCTGKSRGKLPVLVCMYVYTYVCMYKYNTYTYVRTDYTVHNYRLRY